MKIIALLPLLKVRLVSSLIDHTVAPSPVTVHVPVPIVIVRVLELDEESMPIVTFLLLASNVPLVRVRVLADVIVKSSTNWKVPPTPLRTTLPLNVTLLDVIVLVPEVAERVELPVWLLVIPVPIVREPYIILLAVPELVPVNPVKFRLPTEPARLMVSEPAVMFMSGADASASAPGVMVRVPVEPL